MDVGLLALLRAGGVALEDLEGSLVQVEADIAVKYCKDRDF